MHPPHLRAQAIRLHAQGVGFTEIYRRLDIPRNTVASWLYGERSRRAPPRPERCSRCARPSRQVDDPAGYAYLFGQYLGDGHLLMTRRVPLLTVTCDLRYLGIIHEVSEAMRSCGARTVGYQERPGCISVRAHWTHWPCLITQHGQGKKHERPINLAAWQCEILRDNANRFVRGLFHSDGSRFLNRVRHGATIYEYPRYTFVNESGDIMGLCQEALDRLGVEWRMCRRNMLSVARRDSVAALDRYVGPKW